MIGVYRILTVAILMTVLMTVASSAWAQQQQTIRIRGTIEKLDGDTLSVLAAHTTKSKSKSKR